MRVSRTLASLTMALTLVAGLLPTTGALAGDPVPSWGDPSQTYGTPYRQLYGDLTDSGLGNPDRRPAILYRWQAQFDEPLVSHTTFATLDKYDVFVIQKQTDSDSYDLRSGYGLLPQWNTDAIAEFVKNYANGNPQFVLNQVSSWNDPTKNDGLYLLDYVPYVRTTKLIELSGGKFDRVGGTITDDPSAINGTAYFQVSPWPRITAATADGSTLHVAFTTYGLNSGHHPVAHITNGVDAIDKDFGLSSQPVFNGTWDIPVSDVTSRLGLLDKLKVVVEDGYGRTAEAPLGQSMTIIYNWASNYVVPYTTGQPASFTQPLVLTKTQGNAPNPPDKFLNDTLKWEYSVDGGPWQPLTVLPDVAKVFGPDGKLKDKIVIDTNTLNTIPGRLWGSGTHKIQVKVKATPGDQGKYLFTSKDSGGPGPEAVVTVMFSPVHKLGETPTSAGGKLWLKWGQDLPNYVPEAGRFTAPVEISNDGDVPITTTLDFEIDANVVIERVYSCNCKGCTTPPPSYMNFPLKGTITETFTVPAHGVVRWNVSDGISYLVQGYTGPPSGGGCLSYQDYVIGGFIPVPDGDGSGQSPPVIAPLNVGHSAVVGTENEGWTPVFQPNYAAYIKVTPRDPEHYGHSPIDAWVGAKGLSIPPKKKVRIVE